MKYRIITRPGLFFPDIIMYIAQFKFLNLFWLDCEDDKRYPGIYYSGNLREVETFIEAIKSNKKLKSKTGVVKVYD